MSNEIDKLLAGADAPANSNTKDGGLTSIIIGAVVAIGSLVANAGLSRAAEVRNEHAVANAREQEIEQWRRQNAYNSPTSQIARLKAAGINPAIIYGNGIENTSSDSPTLTSPFAAQRMKDIDPLTASQIQLNAAEARKLNSDAEYQQGMLDVEQQRVVEFHRQLDIESDRVEGYLNDLASIVEQRYKDFEEKIREFDETFKLQQENLKVAIEQMGISKENLRLSLEMFPFLSAEKRAQVYYLYQQGYEAKQLGDKAKFDARISELNAEMEGILMGARRYSYATLTKTEQYRMLAELNKYRQEMSQYRYGVYLWDQTDENGNPDPDLWGLYLLSLTNSGQNSSLNPSMFFNVGSRSVKGFQSLKPRPKVGFKLPKVK